MRRVALGSGELAHLHARPEHVVHGEVCPHGLTEPLACGRSASRRVTWTLKAAGAIKTIGITRTSRTSRSTGPATLGTITDDGATFDVERHVVGAGLRLAPVARSPAQLVEADGGRLLPLRVRKGKPLTPIRGKCLQELVRGSADRLRLLRRRRGRRSSVLREALGEGGATQHQTASSDHQRSDKRPTIHPAASG